MGYQHIFERYEIKYRVNRHQMETLLEAIGDRIKGDAYGRSTVCNVYYDTPDYRLIRRSRERPLYKEKLRVRSYGQASPDSTVFVELKKKYRSIVYKRRVSLTEADALAYLAGEKAVEDKQIVREIDYFKDFYAPLQPAMYLCYDREAFYDKEDSGFRITFDDNIRWRQTELSLCHPPGGERLLPEDVILMEVKTATGLPLWFTDVLTREKIFKSPFSKYGTAYTITQQRTVQKTTV